MADTCNKGGFRKAFNDLLNQAIRGKDKSELRIVVK